MTQNTTKTSRLLLQYAVAGQQQLLKANVDATFSLKDLEEAAKQTNVSLERLQELSNARVNAVPLQGKSLDSIRELERAQEAQVAAAGQQLKTEQKITSEVEKQVSLLQRYKDVQAKQRQSLLDTATPSDDALVGNRRRSVTGALTGVREGLISLPNVGYQNPAVVALRGIIPLADRSGASFKQLGAGLGIAAAGAIGVAIAMDRFNQQIEASKRLLTGALAANQNYYDAVADLTTAQVDEQIADLKRVRPLLEQNAAGLRTSLDEAFSGLQQTFVGDIGARALLQATFGDLKAEVESADAALEENIQTETRLSQGREAGVFVANDLREAEQQLVEERQKNLERAATDALTQINEEAAMRLRLAELRRNGTSEQLDARAQAIQDEAELLQNYLIPQARVLAPLTEAGAKALADYETKLRDLNQEMRIIGVLLRPIIIAREREAAAVAAQLSVLDAAAEHHQALAEAIRTSTVEQVEDRLHAIEEERNALQGIIPELERLAPTSQEAADALEAARGRLTGLSADYFAFITQVLPAALKRAADAFAEEELRLRNESAEKIGQIEDQRREKEIEAGEKRDEAYISAREKRDEAEVKLAEDLAKRRKDIERRANATIANAIANRDVLAFMLAKKQRDEDLESLKEDGESRQKEIEAQFLKERRVADDNYRKALAQARKAADDSIRQEQDRLRREIQERAAAYQAQINQLQQFNIQGVQAISNFVDSGLDLLRGLVKGVIGIGDGGGDGGEGGGGGGGGSQYPPANPNVGDTWTAPDGSTWVWNGRAWQPATIVPQSGQTAFSPTRATPALAQSAMRAFSAPPERAFSQASGASGGARGDINIQFTVEGADEERVIERVRVAYRKAVQQLNSGG